jgi:valyl-tRNA synthetase
MIEPEEYMEKYGVDALRMGLISGTANGKDFAFPQDKVISFRNFTNKIWNMARFMMLMSEGKEIPEFSKKLDLTEEDKNILSGLDELIKNVDKSLEKFRFADAGDSIYHFMWNELADKYIEDVKNRENKEVGLSVLKHTYLDCIKLLHPFMPFVTEAIWSEIMGNDKEMLAASEWPKA